MEVLCDDRTWSHGEWPVGSASAAPLRAILFLEKATENHLVPLAPCSKEIVSRLLACLVTPYTPADWWQKPLDVVEQLAREVPCYRLRFDRSGAVVALLEDLCRP